MLKKWRKRDKTSENPKKDLSEIKVHNNLDSESSFIFDMKLNDNADDDIPNEALKIMDLNNPIYQDDDDDYNP